jgi:membrane protease YdiL (CAAX protease family)
MPRTCGGFGCQSNVGGSANRPGVVVGVAVLLTGIAALENTVAPWAPFYVVYAALALVVPFLGGAVTRRELRRPTLRQCLAAIVLALVLHGAFRLMTASADLNGMFGRMLTVAAARLATRAEVVAKWYLLFIQAWAGFGEEVFYRGYVQRSLRTRFTAATSIGATSLLFASRHYTQLLLSWPNVDWHSATIWVAATFVVGVALGWLFEKTASLWPPIIAHFAFNLLA